MSRLLLVAAVATSAALHVAIAGFLPPAEDARVDGGTPGTGAVQGTAFADLVVGGAVRSPVAASEPVQPTPPALRQPARPAVAAGGATLARQPALAKPALEAGAAALTRQPVPLVGEVQRPQPPERDARQPGGTTDAPEIAARPRARPDAPPPQRAPAGNSQQDARRGSPASAAPQGQGAAASPADRSGAVGQADLTNWRGAVLREIQRQPRPRVGGRGTALVSFTVLPSGAVSAVGVSRSSGSSRIDAAAVAHIHRAAPFAPPPGGATVPLTVAFEARG